MTIIFRLGYSMGPNLTGRIILASQSRFSSSCLHTGSVNHFRSSMHNSQNTSSIPSQQGWNLLSQSPRCNQKRNCRAYRSWISPYRRTQLGNDKLLIPSTHAKNFITLPGDIPAKKKEYSERRILGYSMEQMFDVVADVEKYEEFLPWCQSSVIKTRRKSHIVADLVVGMNPLVESYTSSVTMTKPHLIKAESTQGRLFNHLINLWKFSPGLKGKPQTCIVDFYVSFEFRSALTSKVGNVFFNEVVRVMVVAFYNEAKKRYGPESIPSRKISIVSERPS